MSNIPLEAINEAVRYAQENTAVERAGWFGRSPSSGEIEFYPCDNISPRPVVSTQISSREIVDLVVRRKIELVALFHSHPSGYAMPSGHDGGDYDTFPVHYVKDAFIWSPKTPDKVCWYGNGPGLFEFMALEKARVYRQ